MKACSFSLICLFLSTVPILAHDGGTGTVMGSVRIRGEHPLIGATVMVWGTSYGAMTGANGQFIIENLSAGPAKLHVSMIGMTAEELEIEVIPGDTLELDISLDYGSPYSDTTPAVIIRI